MTPPAGDGTTLPGRILVVDDTAFNRRLLARLLRGIGHEPVEAEDGSEALERLRDADRAADRRRSSSTSSCRSWTATRRSPRSRRDAALRAPAGHRHLRRRRARQRRPLHRRWAPPTTCPRPSTRRSSRPGSRASLARKRLHDAEREAIDRQAANNEVLAIMSRSAFDLQVVLDAVVRAALRLCRADYGVAYALDGETFRVAASAGGTPQLDAWERDHPIGPGRDSVVGTGRAARRGDPPRRRPRRPRVPGDPGQQVERLPLADRRADRAGRCDQRRPRPDPQRGPPVHRRRGGARDRLRRAGRDRDRQRAAARDDRAPARPARPVPVAPGRRARLEPRRRGDAGRPPPRDHGDVLRPAQLHGVLRDRPSPRRCSASCAATTPTVGGLVVELRGDARALRGRRADGVLQRPGAPGRPRGAGGPAGGRDPGALRRDQRGVAAARPRPPGRDRDRDRLRDDGPDRVRGPLRLRRRSATRSSSPRG